VSGDTAKFPSTKKLKKAAIPSKLTVEPKGSISHNSKPLDPILSQSNAIYVTEPITRDPPTAYPLHFSFAFEVAALLDNSVCLFFLLFDLHVYPIVNFT
jgi:hypothetical protein